MIHVLRQTLALFFDAYRELNSRRMFWIALVINGIVVLAFLAIGVTPDGNLSLFGMHLPLPLPFTKPELYKVAFSNLGIGIWLTFVGMILAVISTASIFPELITGGAIDLYLSKPIGRLRLFFTKYAAGLLFVTLQVGLFCALCFVVIGLRGGLWEPRLFWGVPIVVCFFSYLFCVSVLVGLFTRSTLAAVLLTMLFWFVVWGLDRAEILLLLGRIYGQDQQETLDLRIKQQRGTLHAYEERMSATQPSEAQAQDLEYRRRELQKVIDEQRESESTARNLELAHKVIYRVKSLLPKTRETNELLDRSLMTPEELRDYDAHRTPGGAIRRRPLRERTRAGGPGWADPEVIAEAQAEMRARPAWWVAGTSLAFEAVVLALAVWVFCRRDY
jgi:hypothetical protein